MAFKGRQPTGRGLSAINLLALDDGRTFDTEGLSGMGSYLIGREQHRQRQAAEMEREREETDTRVGAIGPLGRQYSGGRLIGGPLPSEASDAYYGILQAKENAFGGRMRLAPNSVEDHTYTTNWEDGQTPVSPMAGIEAATGFGRRATVGPREEGGYQGTKRRTVVGKRGQAVMPRVWNQRGGPVFEE